MLVSLKTGKTFSSGVGLLTNPELRPLIYFANTLNGISPWCHSGHRQAGYKKDASGITGNVVNAPLGANRRQAAASGIELIICTVPFKPTAFG